MPRRLSCFSHGYCLLCQQRSHTPFLCTTCEQTLTGTTPPRCQHCGIILPQSMLRCGQCQSNPPPWSYARIAFNYNHYFRYLIARLKFARQEHIATLLAQLFLQQTNGFDCPDLLVPIPLSRFRKWRRGYNQAELLVQSMSASLNRPYSNTLLRRQKHTVAQARLTREQRHHNLKNAFLGSSQLPPETQHIALVDDVFTTGATLKNACLALKARFPNIILGVWAICRA